MTVLSILQIISAALLALSILVQDRGAGLGEAIAGASSARFETQKRGAEKILSQITFALVLVFLGLSVTLNFV